MTDQTEPQTQSGPARPADTAPRCTCGHTRRDHSGRRDHRDKYGPLVAGRPWCHACETECIYCPPDDTEAGPIRKSLLPCIPPPEWEFSAVLGAPHGVMLIPDEDAGPIVVRRRVTWGDWEPVKPDHWAEEEASDVPDATPAPAPQLRKCPRCAADERTRGVLHLSALELYPPDHDPDCRVHLRDECARGIRARLMRTPAPESTRWGGEIGHYGAATEYDLADAVLAVPAIQQMQAGHTALKRAHVALAEQAGKDQAALARVRALRTDWLSTGAPPIGTSIARWWDKRLIELNAALDERSDGAGADTARHCGGTLTHPGHQFMRLDVVFNCPGITPQEPTP